MVGLHWWVYTWWVYTGGFTPDKLAGPYGISNSARGQFFNMNVEWTANKDRAVFLKSGIK